MDVLEWAQLVAGSPAPSWTGSQTRPAPLRGVDSFAVIDCCTVLT